MEYTGPEIRILRESMRMTKLLNGNVSAQSLFQINLSLTDNKAETGSELAGLINWNYAWHYQFRLAENLKILAGPMIDLNGGFVYNTRNSIFRRNYNAKKYRHCLNGYKSRKTNR